MTVPAWRCIWTSVRYCALGVRGSHWFRWSWNWPSRPSRCGCWLTGASPLSPQRQSLTLRLEQVDPALLNSGLLIAEGDELRIERALFLAAAGAVPA